MTIKIEDKKFITLTEPTTCAQLQDTLDKIGILDALAFNRVSDSLIYITDGVNYGSVLGNPCYLLDGVTAKHTRFEILGEVTDDDRVYANGRVVTDSMDLIRLSLTTYTTELPSLYGQWALAGNPFLTTFDLSASIGLATPQLGGVYYMPLGYARD